MRHDERGQLQLVEVITVAVILLTAIAISSVFRLPTSPATFQGAELERIGSDALRIMANTPPQENAACNEPSGSACPFADGSELERMLSLALGYVGPTGPSPEAPNRQPFEDFLGQALPDGVNWVLYYSNGVNATKVVPLARNPPLLDVFVAKTLLAPNWTTFADHLEDSVLVRTGEPGGLGSPTTVRDPLNRAETEFGYALTGLYQGRVPANATLGTHQICYGSDCHYFTVTPSNIFGAGSQILPGDRDNSTNLALVDAGDFDIVVKYRDEGSAGFQLTDPLYVDSDGSGSVTAGDVRLAPIVGCRTGVTCPAGSYVVAGDLNMTETLTALNALTVEIRGHDADANGTVDAGDTIYLTSTGAGSVTSDHRRLSRVGVHALGTSVAAADNDQGRGLGLSFDGAQIWFDDVDGDGSPEPGEALYLDLDGSGLGPGLEEGDYHLTTKGEATAYYFYDVRLVVWFGA